MDHAGIYSSQGTFNFYPHVVLWIIKSTPAIRGTSF